MKVVYVVGIVLILIATVGACGFAAYSGLYQIYSRSSIFPLFEHLIGPLFFMILAIIYYIVACLIGILLLRLYCELIMVIFKINENLQVVRDRN